MLRGRLSPAYRLLILFSLTIFAPGLFLAFFGAQGLWRERDAAENQLLKRLEYSADRASQSLEEQLRRLQTQVEGDAWTPGPTLLDRPADGSWAFAVRDGDGARIYPPQVLPFELWTPESDPFKRPESPADLTHRKARQLKAAGSAGEAARLWRAVEAEGGSIGSVPADLVAGFELAQLDFADAQLFYDRLASGRWRIDRPRYLHYTGAVIDRVKPSEREATSLRLAEALEAGLAGQRVIPSERGVHVAFHRDNPPAALVVSGELLASLVPPAADAEVQVARLIADGHLVFGSPAGSDAALRDSRLLHAGGIAWSVDVEPKDPAAFARAWIQQSNLYLAMLGMVLALLGSGGYLIARTVRREVQVARLKSDFVSTVSHEFRSPLTGIRQLAEMLTRDRVLDEGKRRQYYDLILHESERLGRLVENVLDFARMEDGRHKYHPEAIDTTAWLRNVSTEFERDAARAGFTLETSIPDGLPALTGDREALSTAVRNLLDNAVKYSPGGKTIWLAACAGDYLVRIRTRDEGVGIAARHQPHVFEKFYRVDGDLAQTVKGVGLGLSLVQHIVRAHNGCVSVESQAGKGSTFSIELAGAA
jgi:signal transduction histidine kinase